MASSRIASLASTVFILMMTGCGSTIGFTVGPLSITPTQLNLAVGKSQQLALTNGSVLVLSAKAAATAIWKSAQPSVATVDERGTVLCKAAGQSTVSALLNGDTASAQISCSLTTVVIAGGPVNGVIDESLQLQATASYSGANATDVTGAAAWTSSNTGVAKVRTQGLVTCLQAGSFAVGASYSGASSSIILSCSAFSVAITGGTEPILVGSAGQLHLLRTYADGSTMDITSASTWTSWSPSIVKVDTNGTVFCVAAGSSQISSLYLKQGDVNATSTTASVSCREGLKSLALTPGSVASRVGESVQLALTATAIDGTISAIPAGAKWSSSSPLVRLSDKGFMACTGVGMTTVTASYLQVSGSVVVTCAPRTWNTVGYFREQSDDFVGPFSSWNDVKTAFGAKGDGITDDTKAIQRALDTLGAKGASPVLWFPTGIYRITSPLIVTHKQDFSILGEDAKSVIIKWDGAQGATMLTTDASQRFVISRLSFDGSGIAGVAESLTDLHTPGQGYYSTFNELSDQHIYGVNTSIVLGVDAETTINRVKFDHPTRFGVSVEGWNTLNIFINDSLFVGCGTGVTNTNAAGNFIVSNSAFVQSVTADMSIYNTGYFTARHNISVASRAFFVSGNAGSNNGTITAQNNTILDPSSSAFVLGNLGPFMFFDNVVRQHDSSIPTVLGTRDITALKALVVVGNSFSPNAGPITEENQPFEGKITQLDNSIVDSSMIPDVAVPSDVYQPVNNHRAVFEVSSFTGEAIQAAIDKAIASGVQRPTVHLPYGIYAVTKTITVPAGADLQIIGDNGWTTILLWKGGVSKQGAMRIMTGNVTIKNIHIWGANQGETDGISLPVQDQASTQIILDQTMLQGDNNMSVNFDGVEHLTAEMFSTYTMGAQSGLSVSSGAFRKAKEATFGVTNFYNGSMQSIGTGTSFNVFNRGEILIQDNWHDGGQTSPYNFVLSGGGRITEQAGVVKMSSSTPFVINNFDGQIALIGLQFDGGFQVTDGKAHTDLLNMGLVGSTTNYLPTAQDGVTMNNIANSYYISAPGGGGGHIAQDDAPDAQWLRKMLSQTRSENAIARTPVSSRTSRILLSRVSVDKSDVAVHVTPAETVNGLNYVLSTAQGSLTSGSNGCPTMAGAAAGGRWVLIPGGDGDFQLVSAATGAAVGVSSDAAGNSTVVMVAKTADYSQRWQVRNAGDGRFLLNNRHTGELLSSSASSNGCVGVSATQNDTALWSAVAY